MVEEEAININDDSQIYEIGYHILPTIAEENVSAETAKIKSAVVDNGGSIISEEAAGLKVLAYEISKIVDSKKVKFSRAYFGWIKFEIEKSKIGKIESLLKSTPSVLRFLIIKTVRENTLHIPKVPMYRKDENDSEKIEPEEKVEISQEEIDKSIDELLTTPVI